MREKWQDDPLPWEMTATEQLHRSAFSQSAAANNHNSKSIPPYETKIKGHI
jgi:hypothetical protein